MLKKVNCDAAAKLRAGWPTLVNEKFATDAICDKYKVQKFDEYHKTLESALKEAHFEDSCANYNAVRDKVCELMVAKAMFRPLKADETRKAAMMEAKKTVEALSGQLPVLQGVRVAHMIA